MHCPTIFSHPPTPFPPSLPPSLPTQVAISALYVALTALQSFTVDFLQSDHGLSPRRASFSASIFDVTGIFLGPFLGKWVDQELGRKGGREGGRKGSRLWPPGSMQSWGSVLTAVGLLLPIVAVQRWEGGRQGGKIGRASCRERV